MTQSPQGGDAWTLGAVGITTLALTAIWFLMALAIEATGQQPDQGAIVAFAVLSALAIWIASELPEDAGWDEEDASASFAPVMLPVAPARLEMALRPRRPPRIYVPGPCYHCGQIPVVPRRRARIVYRPRQSPAYTLPQPARRRPRPSRILHSL